VASFPETSYPTTPPAFEFEAECAPEAVLTSCKREESLYVEWRKTCTMLLYSDFET